MKFLWEKTKAYKEELLVTMMNKYQGLILLIMLLVIWYKQFIYVRWVPLRAHFINCLNKEVK